MIIHTTTNWTFFWNGPFSNWYPAKFIYKGIKFENSEQAFMWEKAMHFKDVVISEMILKTPNPADVKKLGRQVIGYDDVEWSKVRYKYMFDVCLQKFSQNQSLKLELLNKSNFVEASPYDRIWGIGMMEGDFGIENPNNWKGLNLLGKVLDEVRSSINK